MLRAAFPAQRLQLQTPVCKPVRVPVSRSLIVSRNMSTTAALRQPADVLLVGLGSMGTSYAYLMEKSGLVRVSAVARSNYDLYDKGEVTIDSNRFGEIKGWKPYRLFKSQQEALADGTQYALGVLTTKVQPDIIKSSDIIAPALASGQVDAWCLCQNGLGIERDVYDAIRDTSQQLNIPPAPVISALSWVFMTTSQGGRHVRWANTDTTVSGVYRPKDAVGPNRSAGDGPSPAEQAALQLWTDALMPNDLPNRALTADDIESVRYSKNMWNCLYASIQTLMGASQETVLGLPAEDLAPLRQLAKEILTVGYETGLLYEGMTLYPSMKVAGALEDTLNVIWDNVMVPNGFLTNYKFSMLVDRLESRPIEVEVITGSVLRIARAYGVDTPMLSLVYTLLKGVQGGLLEARKK